MVDLRFLACHGVGSVVFCLTLECIFVVTFGVHEVSTVDVVDTFLFTDRSKSSWNVTLCDLSCAGTLGGETGCVGCTLGSGTGCVCCTLRTGTVGSFAFVLSIVARSNKAFLVVSPAYMEGIVGLGGFVRMEIISVAACFK